GMKKRFRAYFRPTAEEFDDLWEKAIFTFDANFLLNVYRYTPETQQKMLLVLEKLGDNVWIPHQAALEFHRNRLGVIAKQAGAYEQARKAIEDTVNRLQGQLSQLARHPVINCDKITTAVSGTARQLIDELECDSRKHPDLHAEDTLREELAR